MLAPLGLGPAEEQVYRLLVTRRAARLPELASASGLTLDQTVVPHRQNTAELAGMARGVRYRALLDRRALTAPNMSADVQDSLARGQEIRVVDAVPVKMMIVDGETALLPLHNDQPEHPASILVHRSGLLAILIAFFEAEWSRAYPLRTDPAGNVAELHPQALDDIDRQVLALLLSGLTDQALASQLEMSLRTLHRRIRHLMDKAGVQSRIQLGWAAARNEWA